jgi:hypothetical protein
MIRCETYLLETHQQAKGKRPIVAACSRKQAAMSSSSNNCTTATHSSSAQQARAQGRSGAPCVAAAVGV